MRRDLPPYGALDGRMSERVPQRTPPPGQTAVVLAGVTIGVLLMGIQLWLLTVALDLYLGGAGDSVWPLVAVSGLVFLGGILALFLLSRH